MAFYEVVFIARHDLSKPDVQKLAQDYAAIITEMGGSVLKNEYWGLRQLAYRINKANKGHYTMLGVDAPYAAVAEVSRKMRIDENVIRQLVIKVEKMDASPSVMMKQPTEGASDAAA